MGNMPTTETETETTSTSESGGSKYRVVEAFAWDAPQTPRTAQTAPEKPRVPGAVRFVCVSDTHDSWRGESKAGGKSGPDVPMGDVLVHAGDFTRSGKMDEVARFRAWLEATPHEHKVVVAGNHETTLDADYYRKRGARMMGHRPMQDPDACRALLTSTPGITYLENSFAMVAGVGVWGSPVTPTFCDWAFNVDAGPDIAKVWATIPSRGVDVLVTHGPPRGHGDRCEAGNLAGCADLLARVEAVRPALHVFGHIHEGYGVTRNAHTVFVNASTCTVRYRATNPPIVVDLVPIS